MTTMLYRDATVIDGLMASAWSPEHFKEMHEAGLTTVHMTSVVWEGFVEATEWVARLNALSRELDFIKPVRTVADIEAAKAEGKLGVALGFQNSSPLEGQLSRVQIFKELGVGFMQLTYNTQNDVATGCYETKDVGLSDFGAEVVAEMHRVGMVVDLSHCSRQTTEDVIALGGGPVVFSHTYPRAFTEHPRTKSDEQIRAVAETGGVIGISNLPWYYPNGFDSTVGDFLDAVEHIIDVAGEDHAVIGTDFMPGHTEDRKLYFMRDKGSARELFGGVQDGVEDGVIGLAKIRDFSNLGEQMQSRGWTDERARKVLGENWTRLLRAVWGG